MKGTLRRARRKVGAIRRRLFEMPEQAAWRRAWHQAETTPRFTPGMIRMMDYDIRYSDLLSFCPQWQDIFVKRVLAFESASPAPRILDCGANVGLASLFFRRLYPSARITAFEADPTLFQMLDANLKANGAADVETRHAALWTSTGSLTFHCEGSDSGMIGSLPGAVAGRSTTVPSLRLRDVLAEGPVDLLKLDIEGAEDAVLADCEPVLDRVKALVLDLHEFDPAARQAPRVLEGVARAGFTYAIDGFVPLTWRDPLSGATTPFPGKAMQWAMTVRAWRDGR
jgi:FkbM family methyltransferase